jgi:hypothetical protein
MHQLFDLDRVRAPPLAYVMFFGVVDMAYAFCLFWPASITPVLILVCQMQVFIPLDTIVGSLCCARSEYLRHLLLSVFIIIGVVISAISYYIESKDKQNSDEIQYYFGMLIIGQVLNVFSHQGK